MEVAPTILAIDFDETITHHLAYPDLGVPRPYAPEIFRRLKDEGFYIIIWTCREGEQLKKIEEWMKHYDMPFDMINEHHPYLNAHYKKDTRKILADIYIEDRCLLPFPEDWLSIYHLIKQKDHYLRSKEKLQIQAVWRQQKQSQF
jgi:hypothetical protein